MPNCCGGASCACKIDPGEGIAVSGSGSPQDPFVISADRVIQTADNVTFDVSVTGAGTTLNPWVLSVTYASTAKLDHIPDVDAPSPTNGQVLGWDNSLQKWTPRAPTTAPTGAVSHDTSLQGDGSVGDVLRVNANSARGVESTASGVGLTDATMNMLVRRYTDAAERAATSPTPVVNSLSALTSNPGEIDYYDGSAWVPVKGPYDSAIQSTGFMQMSGAYDGTRLTRLVKEINDTTDANGLFDVLSITDLAGAGGVLTMQFTETGDDPLVPSLAHVTVYPQTDHVVGVALTITDGTPLASQPVMGLVEAWLY
jgi:hypothetical protein